MSLMVLDDVVDVRDFHVQHISQELQVTDFPERLDVFTQLRHEQGRFRLEHVVLVDFVQRPCNTLLSTVEIAHLNRRFETGAKSTKS